jgi:hypothetical protein
LKNEKLVKGAIVSKSTLVPGQVQYDALKNRHRYAYCRIRAGGRVMLAHNIKH